MFDNQYQNPQNALYSRINISQLHEKCLAVEEYSNVFLENSCHYCVRMIDPVHRVVRVSEQGVGEAGLQEVHGEEGGDGDNLVEQDVDTLPVPDVLPGALLAQSQEAGGGEGQELLESVLDVIVTPEAEQAAQQLVDGRGQAVNIVAVTLQLSLGQSRGHILCA